MRLSDGREFVVGVTAGSGAVATISAHAGADFLLAINAARLRNQGAPSIACMLPLADAKQMVDQYADVELLSHAQIPVLVGVNCWRDDFDARAMAEEVLERGFAGVVNFPPSSLYPDTIRRRLDAAGVGLSAELEMLKTAQDAGCIALTYCRTVSDGREAALRGLDNILLNFGWNSGGRLSPSSENTLDEAATIAASFARQIRRIKPDTCLLLEGGPVESEEDLEVVLRHADINGYIGGSTFERLPVERSIADRIASFKLARTRHEATGITDRQLISFGRRSGFIGGDHALLAVLRKLHAARQARRRITCLGVPVGENMTPAIQALTRPTGGTRAPRVVSLSGEDLPHARQQLFGEEKNQGILRDAQTDVLVLRHPEALDQDIQAELASVITSESVSERPLGPRVIFACHCADDTLPAALHPDLAQFLQASLIQLPPLRDRAGDIQELLSLAMQNQTQARAPARGFSPAATLRLRSYDWPGNTAELVAMCTQFAQNTVRKPVSIDEVEAVLAPQASVSATVGGRRQLVVEALKRNGFRKGQTAQALGISRKTLYNWMKSEGLS